MGWRYYCFTTGALVLFLWAVRFTMPLLESPRYLVGKGKDEEAVRVVHELARYNGKTSSLTLEHLLVAEGKTLEAGEGGVVPGKGALRFVSVGARHLKGLFATKRMAFSTSLICLINCTCAVQSPLPFCVIMTLLQWWWGSGCHYITRSYHTCETIPRRSSSLEVIPLLIFPKNCDSWSSVWRFVTEHYVSQRKRVPFIYLFHGYITNNPAMTPLATHPDDDCCPCILIRRVPC